METWTILTAIAAVIALVLSALSLWRSVWREGRYDIRKSLERIETDGKRAHDQIGSNIDRLRQEVREDVKGLRKEAREDRNMIEGKIDKTNGVVHAIRVDLARLVGMPPASAPASQPPASAPRAE